MPKLPPPPPARTEGPRDTLEARIALAAQRVQDRDQALRLSARALVQRAQAAMEPRRLLVPVAGALGGLALLWVAARVLRRPPAAERARAAAKPAGTPAAPSTSRSESLPWASAAALLWPLLPVAWRGRMGPDTASILVTLGLALAGWLFQRRVLEP